MADQWEPGPPSLRAMAPSVVWGALIPLAVYYLVRAHVHGDAPALVIAGAVPAAWVVVQLVRTRRVDPIGCITLFGFAAGVVASAALGGNAFVLKVRDSAFTALFGLACLASLAAARPAMFYIGRALSAGGDREKSAAFDALLDLPGGSRTFRVITAVWGAGLIGEAAARVVLAVGLPTGAFLAASPVLAGLVFGGLFLFTVKYAALARRRGEAELEGTGVVYPSVQAAAAAPSQVRAVS